MSKVEHEGRPLNAHFLENICKWEIPLLLEVGGFVC